MLCEETKESLSLYIDDCVSLPTRVEIDHHLELCPVCRDEAVQLRSLTRSLSLLTRPIPPANLTDTITDTLMIESLARRQQPRPSLARRVSQFLEPKLMPYTVGSVASVFLFAMMFLGLRPHVVALHEAAVQTSGVIVVQPSRPIYDLTQPVDAEAFAASRAPFSEVSPSLNPDGALAALTRANAHPQHGFNTNSDDMIVVANVFSNGSASLADVVSAPRDRRMLDDFESALRQDAAFVPAALDRRPDTMRVVFTVQKVDVDDNF